MKPLKNIIILLLLCPFPIAAQQQDVLSKEYLAGRWGSNPYSLEDIPPDSIVPLQVYIFKDNMTFHRGNVTEGAIIFNVTGSYTISGDTVKMFYQDYLNHTQATRRLMKTFLKVFYSNDNRMDADIITPANPSTVTLRRQKPFE